MSERDRSIECPACGLDRVVERVYGLPGPELWAASESGADVAIPYTSVLAMRSISGVSKHSNRTTYFACALR